MGNENSIVESGQCENLLIIQSAQASLVSVAKVDGWLSSPNAKDDRSPKISVGLKPNCHDLTVCDCC